jgi:transcriptional regulator with XRE-family HTH domain
MSIPTPRGIRRTQLQLGEDLRTWRLLKRLTMEPVTDRAGVGRTTLLRLEARDGAYLGTVLRVARALGVSLSTHRPGLIAS